MMLEAIVGVALRAILASVILGGVLAGVVLVATRALALTAAARHALWTTALLATGLMPLAGVATSVARAVAAQPAPAPATAWHVTAAPTSAAPARELRRVSAHATAPASTWHAGTAAPDRFAVLGWTPRISRRLALAGGAVWAIGALIGLFTLAASVARVRGLKRRSSPLDGTLADELPWLTDTRTGREIYVRLSYETETPVAIGFSRPVILIPTELATADGLAAIEPLIMHEYAHLRRRDDWTNLVQRLIERIFWFNPIVWYVGRRIALEREIASDDAVVERTGEAHAYATSLWRLAREMRMPEHAVVAPGALLTRKQITIRIEQLLDQRRSRLHPSPAASLLTAAASLAAVALVATSAPAVELPAAPEQPVAGATARPASTRDTWSHPAPKRAAVARTPSAGTRRTLPPPRVGTTAQAAAPIPPALVAPPAGLKTAVPPQALPRAPASPRRAHPEPRSSGSSWRYEFGDAAAAGAAGAAAGASAQAAAAAARGAVRTAVRGTDFASIGPAISKGVQDAMRAIPREVAQTSPSSHHNVFDGVKLSRETIASCTACSFRNADARGVDLHGLALSGDDFSDADLRGANLAGSRLVGVSLARANLSNADLRNARLSGVELRGAIFDGAQLEGIKLVGVSFRSTSLRGVTLRSVLANCTGCDFGTLDLHGQDLHGIALTGADLSHADLHDANLSGVRFVGVDLSHANLRGADLTNASLSGCDLSGIDLHGAHITGMTMPGSDGLDG